MGYFGDDSVGVLAPELGGLVTLFFNEAKIDMASDMDVGTLKPPTSSIGGREPTLSRAGGAGGGMMAGNRPIKSYRYCTIWKLRVSRDPGIDDNPV